MRKMLLPLFCLFFAYSFAQKPVLTCHDLVPGAGSSLPRDLFSVNGRLYFTADSPGKGRELWIYDKPGGKTEMIMDINPGKNGSSASSFAVAGNKVYFSATTDSIGHALWETDGTTAGTQLVADIWPNKGNYGGIGCKAVLNGNLIGIGDDSVHGRELWVSDGTAAGTRLLKDINPGIGYSYINDFTLYKNKAYFVAYEPAESYQLWVTDGTGAGTVRFSDLNPGARSYASGRMWVHLDELYFVGSAKSAGGPYGWELCKTDGTAAGTQMVKDIWPKGESGIMHASELVEYKGKLYFSGDDSVHGRELWVTDGTEQGTHMVADIQPGGTLDGGDPVSLTVYNGLLYFSARGNGVNAELWVTDGTAQGTRLYEEIRPGIYGSDPSYLTVYNGYLYFRASAADGRSRVMRTDGINPVEIVTPGLELASFTVPLYVFDSSLYFCASDTVHGYELWSLKDTVKHTGTGIRSGEESGSGVVVYPNPNNGNFTINSPENGSLQIINMQGQVVLEQDVEKDRNEIKLPAVVKGIYMLRLTGDSGNIMTDRVVIN